MNVDVTVALSANDVLVICPERSRGRVECQGGAAGPQVAGSLSG